LLNTLRHGIKEALSRRLSFSNWISEKARSTQTVKEIFPLINSTDQTKTLAYIETAQYVAYKRRRF